MKVLYGMLVLLLALGVAFGTVACQATDEEEDHHEHDDEPTPAEATHYEHFEIEGLQCEQACVGAVTEALRDKVHGVVDVEIDFQGMGEVSPAVVGADRELSQEEIRDVIHELEFGFQVAFPEDEADVDDPDEDDHDDDQEDDEDEEDEDEEDEEEDDEVEDY